jgi:hypothetical protein
LDKCKYFKAKSENHAEDSFPLGLSWQVVESGVLAMRVAPALLHHLYRFLMGDPVTHLAGAFLNGLGGLARGTEGKNDTRGICRTAVHGLTPSPRHLLERANTTSAPICVCAFFLLSH